MDRETLSQIIHFMVHGPARGCPQAFLDGTSFEAFIFFGGGGEYNPKAVDQEGSFTD